MSIRFFNEDVRLPKFKKRIISSWIKQAIFEEGFEVGEISFIFCSDSYLLDVNRKYLNHDYFTDIITFDYVENGLVSGDIFISVDRVKENSGLFNVSFFDELKRILIHGILHLTGYNDKSDPEKQVMTQKENFYLDLYKSDYLL